MGQKCLLLLIVLLLMAGQAVCADDKGLYLGLNAGANLFVSDTENENSLGHFNLDFKDGGKGSLALGYRLAEGSKYGTGRIELEIGYRKNGVDQAEFSDGKVNAEGDAVVWDIMLNSFAEYRNKSLWTPYFGGGLGMANVSLDDVKVTGALVVDDDDMVLAYQVGGGVNYALSKTVHLDFGYRFYGTTDPTLKDADGEKFDTEYQVHNLQLGIWWLF